MPVVSSAVGQISGARRSVADNFTGDEEAFIVAEFEMTRNGNHLKVDGQPMSANAASSPTNPGVPAAWAAFR